MIAVLQQRHQTATRWVPTPSTDGFSPGGWAKTTLKVRWEERTELFIDTLGEEVRSRAVVYTQTDLVVGEYLALGNSTVSNPTDLSSAYEIKDFRSIPSLRGNVFTKRVML